MVAEQLPQAQSFCDPVDGQNIGAMADGFHFDVGRGHPSLDMAVNLFSDIADMLLDNLALDPDVFDFGKIDRITPFDFPMAYIRPISSVQFSKFRKLIKILFIYLVPL
jgi:hypothetical protein